MRAVSADFCARQHDLKSKVLLYLAAQSLQRLAKKFFHFPATQADHVGMFLLQAGFVIVLVAAHVHQVQLVDQTAFLQHLQGAVDRHPVELRILLLREFEQRFGVQMFAGFVNQFQQDFTLPGKANALRFQGILDADCSHFPLSVPRRFGYVSPNKKTVR